MVQNVNPSAGKVPTAAGKCSHQNWRGEVVFLWGGFCSLHEAELGAGMWGVKGVVNALPRGCSSKEEH